MTESEPFFVLHGITHFELAQLRSELSAEGVAPDEALKVLPADNDLAERYGEPGTLTVALIIAGGHLAVSALALWLAKRRLKEKDSEEIIVRLPDGTVLEHRITRTRQLEDEIKAEVLAQIKDIAALAGRPSLNERT